MEIEEKDEEEKWRGGDGVKERTRRGQKTYMGHHHHSKDLNEKNLLISILLNLLITVVEFIGGIFSNSLALISDATHNLSDTLALALAYIAQRISKRAPSEMKTFGYKRIEILVSLFNSSLLIAISFFLFWEAWKRFHNPEPIREKIMFIVAVVGLLANLISVFLLQKDSRKNLNIKAAYLHLLGDTFSSVAVIGGSVLIYFFGIFWIDPLLTVLIGLFIIKKTYSVLKETIDILMETSPKNLDINKIKAVLENLPEISNIHHIHTWNLTDREIHFECHADLAKNITISESDKVRMEAENILKKDFQIHHVTIQMEFDSCKEKNPIGHS